MNTNIITGGVEAIIDRASPSANPGDYVSPAGLLICGRCGEPRQCRIHLLGRGRIVGCACRCDREAYEAERKAIADAEAHKRIEAMREAGIPDPGLRAKTFSSSTPSPQLEQAQKYVEAWEQMQAHNIGLLLWGSPDGGKTHTGACVANALIDRGVRAGISSTAELMNTTYNDRPAELRRLIGLDLLVLDDLGAERDSAYAMEVVYAVVDGRLKAGRPMVITTNLSLSDLRDPGDMARARIYQRVLEACQPVRFDGPRRRPEISAAKRRILAEVFGAGEGGATNG